MCLMVVATLGLQSCKSSEGLSKGSSLLDGEWEIIEIKGESVLKNDHQPFPYIAFDQENGRFGGTSGCNRMMGEMKQGKKTGSLSFGKIAGTLMMCQNMDTERKVVAMLEEVKSYKYLKSDQIALYGSGKKPIAILNPKAPDMTKGVLSASFWKVLTMNGEELSGPAPDMKLNPEEKTVSGFAGCNRMSGELKVDGNKISFGRLGVTRMMCDNMNTEDQFLKNIEKVVTYKISDNQQVLFLFGESGEELMTLHRIHTADLD